MVAGWSADIDVLNARLEQVVRSLPVETQTAKVVKDHIGTLDMESTLTWSIAENAAHSEIAQPIYGTKKQCHKTLANSLGQCAQKEQHDPRRVRARTDELSIAKKFVAMWMALARRSLALTIHADTHRHSRDANIISLTSGSAECMERNSGASSLRRGRHGSRKCSETPDLLQRPRSSSTTAAGENNLCEVVFDYGCLWAHGEDETVAIPVARETRTKMLFARVVLLPSLSPPPPLLVWSPVPVSRSGIQIEIEAITTTAILRQRR